MGFYERKLGHCHLSPRLFLSIQGDLHEFLMGHSPRNESTNEFGQQPAVLEQNEMLLISTQIAAGIKIQRFCP